MPMTCYEASPTQEMSARCQDAETRISRTALKVLDFCWRIICESNPGQQRKPRSEKENPNVRYTNPNVVEAQ
jgi:hypothetical protein